MNEKRFRKMAAIAQETRTWFRTLGDFSARRGIVAWGSQYGLLREWIAARADMRVFLPEILHPFPLQAFEQWRRGLDSLVVLDLSYQGQFHRHIAGMTSMNGVRSVTRSGGAPLNTAELEKLLQQEAL
jgi:pyruvate/2-oxoacid:ferredoxin oxidoreductase alpha subunit